MSEAERQMQGETKSEARAIVVNLKFSAWTPDHVKVKWEYLGATKAERKL